MTDRWLASLSMRRGRAEYCDAAVPGLRLRATPQSKSWSVVVQREGARARIDLGDYPSVSLSAARIAARTIKDAPRDRSVTAMARAAKAAQETRLEAPPAPVRAVCEGYVKKLASNGQPSAPKVDSTLVTGADSFTKFIEARYGPDFSAENVTPEIVTAWLRETHRRAPGQVGHCRGDLHAAFAWALQADYDFTRETDEVRFVLKTNPVASVRRAASSRKRSRVLTERELNLLWRLLPDVASAQMTIAIRLMIAMGGLRITEIGRSQKGWYKDGWLRLPKTKNDHPHAAPLTRRATELHEMAMELSSPRSPFLFPSERDVGKSFTLESFGKAATRIVDAYGIDPFQLRDLRRTFKTHLLERELVEERAIDIWHNHGRNSDVARAHYDWAEHRAAKARAAAAIDAFLSDVLRLEIDVPSRLDVDP